MPFCCLALPFGTIDTTFKKEEENTEKEQLVRMENGFSNHESQPSQPPTYEEAFPPLGSPTLPGPDPMFPSGTASAYGGGGGGGTQSAWPVKSIPSSSVTQVRDSYSTMQACTLM